MKGLTGKRVLVTGGASGIGAATARRFVEEGARVVVLDVNVDGCDRTGISMPGLAGTLVADVSDPGEVEAAFLALDAMVGGLDVLVNNAGISIRHALPRHHA